VGAGVFVAVAAAPALLIIPLMAGAYGYSATKAADTSKPPQAEAGAGTPPEVEAKAGTPPEVEAKAGTPPEVEAKAGTPPEVEAKAGTPPEVEARAGAKEAEQEQNRMAVEGLLEAIKANNDKIITDSLHNATGIKF
jgi:hypothetical protein